MEIKFVRCFSDMLSAFLSYSSLVNKYSLKTNMTPNCRKFLWKQKQVATKMSDVRFYMYKTRRMIGINSKNCEEKLLKKVTASLKSSEITKKMLLRIGKLDLQQAQGLMCWISLLYKLSLQQLIAQYNDIHKYYNDQFVVLY